MVVIVNFSELGRLHCSLLSRRFEHIFYPPRIELGAFMPSKIRLFPSSCPQSHQFPRLRIPDFNLSATAPTSGDRSGATHPMWAGGCPSCCLLRMFPGSESAGLTWNGPIQSRDSPSNLLASVWLFTSFTSRLAHPQKCVPRISRILPQTFDPTSFADFSQIIHEHHLACTICLFLP